MLSSEAQVGIDRSVVVVHWISVMMTIKALSNLSDISLSTMEKQIIITLGAFVSGLNFSFVIRFDQHASFDVSAGKWALYLLN